MNRIFISNQQKEKAPFRGYKTVLRRAIAATLEEEEFPAKAEISLTLVSREEIRRLNREYRKVDRETDVLSFPLTEIGEAYDRIGEFVPLGDILICPQVIARQAEEFQTTYRQELCLMVIHSTLHLLGWDHEEEAEKKEMFRLQEEILRSLDEGDLQTESERKES